MDSRISETTDSVVLGRSSMLEEHGAGALLKVDNLHTHFFLPNGVLKAVDGMSLEVERGEVVAVVGESGSGKSVTALSILRLIPQHQGRIVNGRLLFKGHDLMKKSNREMQEIRGKQIAMIFQNPYAALNPVVRLGNQLIETARKHRAVTKREGLALSLELLSHLDLEDPERIVRLRPFQVSGGINQRIMLALALIGEPQLLIADEPTTMLDSLTQVEILELIDRVQRETGMAVLLISHDLGVVAQVSDRVVVMYMGQRVEQASTGEILNSPKHPYTIGLRDSVPDLETKGKRLPQIQGRLPDPQNLPEGCRFAPRCPHAMERCFQSSPPEFRLADNTLVKCWLFETGSPT